MAPGRHATVVLFLTATVVAALFAGLTVRSGSEYMAWLAERAERLEIERDQQAAIGAARSGRDRSGDARHRGAQPLGRDHPGRRGSVVGGSDPTAAEAMEHVSAVGRQALRTCGR